MGCVLVVYSSWWHFACEEEVLYPLLRKNLPDGEQVYNHSLEEHQVTKNLLYQLDQMEITDPRFESILNECMNDTLKHVKEEEDIILPSFEKTVSSDKLVELGVQFEEKKSTVPTRPHPSAPATYPFNVAANTLAVPLDKVRDAVRFSETTSEEARR